MRTTSLTFLLAYAALIAACTATGDVPNAPNAPSAPKSAAPGAPSAPSAPTAPEAPKAPSAPKAPTAPTAPAAPALTPATPATAASAAAPKNLKSAMKGIEEDWQAIEKALAPGATADPKALAGAAERVAAVMKLAYDPWEDKEVPNFGKFAHEAEDAFRAFATKAKAGDAAGVQELGKTLQPQHCARCHDAVEQVHG